MATPTPLRLAFLVLNDTHRDSRVLRMADSAVAQGYQVRVFAISSHRFRPGLEVRASGAEVLRQRIAPDSAWSLISAGRRATGGLATPREGQIASGGSAISDLMNWSRRNFVRIGTAAAAFSKTRLRRRFDRLTTSNVFEWAPDLVHAHDANTLQIAINIKRRLGVPFVYDAHELWEMRFSSVQSTTEQTDDAALLDRATAMADGIVTVSPSVADWMTQRYRLPEPPTLVRNIPPAAEVDDPSGGRLHELTGLGDAAKIVVYVGIIGPNRGLEQMIEALAALPTDLHLVMLGYCDDAYEGALMELASSCAVADRVRLAGSVEPHAVSRTIADADVSLVVIQATYLNDEFSLPNKLFESIHGGVPILASNLPDISDLINAYGLGMTIPSNTPEELAATTRALLANPERFRSACVAASRVLTWENEVSRLFSLYHEVLAPS